VNTSAVVQAWLATNQVQVLEHPPYLPDLVPAGYFLFRSVKEELAGIQLILETLKNIWEEVVRNIGIYKFPAAFRGWLDKCNKRRLLNSGYIEKS
jgi:hypothetical protein